MAQEAVVMEPKIASAAAQRSARRRPEPSAPQPDAAMRYFLASKDAQGGNPSLAREVANENEALIESIKTGVSFYAVTEYRAVPDLTGRAPTIRKQPVRKAEARDERQVTSSK